jgi:hypothetical protein
MNGEQSTFSPEDSEAAEAPYFDLLDVAECWSAEIAGPCVGDTGPIAEGVVEAVSQV